ncbi:hypothetical protein ACWEQ8_05180 [Streptomyces noursei]
MMVSPFGQAARRPFVVTKPRWKARRTLNATKRARHAEPPDQLTHGFQLGGRLLSMSMASPNAGTVLADLMTYGSGMGITERAVTASQAGRSPRESSDLAMALLRRGKVLHYTEPEA